MASWALACPRGHRSIELSVTRFRCHACYQAGRRSNFDRSELVDLRREDPPLADGGPRR